MSLMKQLDAKLDEMEQKAHEPILMDMHKDVWCVWTKKGRRPRFFHPTYEGAIAEARRLALKHPDQNFIVMHMTNKIGVVSNGLAGLSSSGLTDD